MKNQRDEAKIKTLMGFANKYLAKNYGWIPGFFPTIARGCRIGDRTENYYLDMAACYSALNFGYGQTVIINAAKECLDAGLAIAPGFILTPDKVLLAKELTEFCGMDDAEIVLMNSGAEAVETAMKLARKWGYRKKGVPEGEAGIIFCENNFHGRTFGVISASTVQQYRDGFGPFLPGISLVPFGDVDSLEQMLKSTQNETVAFIVEPIQGEGGIVLPPPGYLKAVRKLCTKYKVLMVCDEIQTGFGRTGKVFACDYERVRPDLFTFGKALGGGILPISAVVGIKEVMEVFQPGDHGGTFGGNPLACRIARTVIRLMQEEHPEKNAAKLGAYFMAELKKLARKYRFVKEIRGRGLMIGMELETNGPTAHEVCEALFQERLITKETREYIVRFSPPLTICKEEIDLAVSRIQGALAALQKRKRR